MQIRTIKRLTAFVLLAIFVMGITTAAWGTYVSITRQHLQLLAAEGLLLAAMPIGFIFTVRLLAPNRKNREP